MIRHTERISHEGWRKSALYYGCIIVILACWESECSTDLIYPVFNGTLDVVVDMPGFSLYYNESSCRSVLWSHSDPIKNEHYSTATAGWWDGGGELCSIDLNQGYELHCAYDHCSLFSKFTKTGALDLSYNNSVFKAIVGSQLTITATTIRLKYCEETVTQMKHANCARALNAGYLSETWCNCTGDSHIYPNTSEKFLMQCEKDARWIATANHSCWYAPEVELIPLHRTYFENENETFICNVTKGNPAMTWLSLRIGTVEYDKNDVFDKEVMFNVTLKPQHNMGLVSCIVSNEYLFKKGGGPAESPTSVTINVMHGPVVQDNITRCFANSDGTLNVNITIQFYANAYNISVEPAEIWKKMSLTIGANDIVTKGLYQARLKVGKNFSLSLITNYTLEAIPLQRSIFTFNATKDCELQAQPTTTVVHLLASTTSSISPAKPYVLTDSVIAAIASSGGVLLLLVIILICLMLKKQRAAGVKKEEVTNPIYATTSVINKDDASIKEERENPLYDTTSGASYAPVNKKNKKAKQAATTSQQAEPNETYATVNKIKEGKKKKVSDEQEKADETYVPLDKIKKGKKKKDKNGQSNDGFSGAPEALYAAVNKKKDAAGGSDQPSTSGLGRNGDAAEECTYAAVQKKGNRKPKRDGSDDEDLHGSTKP